MMTETIVSSPSTAAARSAELPGTAAPIRSRDWIGWGFVALSLLAQFGLFRQFALREVVWSYPTSSDQLAYLEQSYQTYERILDHGILGGIKSGMGFGSNPVPLNAAGATLHPQAAVLYLLAGPSRFAAISLNFIYYAALQLVLVWSVRWLSGSWSAALLAQGMLLTCMTGFFVPGGRFDFRLDFIAFCLFGIFIGLVIRSGVFSDWRWSAVAGAGGAVLGTFRFISLSYLLGIFALLATFLAFMWLTRRNQASDRHTIRRRIQGSLVSGGVIVLIAAPILWHHAGAVQSYYVAGHLKTGEKEMRAAETATTTLREALEFYPTHLIEDHLGSVFLQVSEFVLLTAALAAAAGMILSFRRGARPESRFDTAAAFCFVALCVVVPMTVLTADTAKAAQVAGIMVAPAVWLVVLATLWLVGAMRGRRKNAPGRWVLRAVAIFAIAAGLWTQFTQYMRPTFMSQDRSEVEKLIGMYDLMADKCRELDWKTPGIACDCNADYLYQKNLTILAYERHQMLLTAGMTIGGLNAYPLDDLFTRLHLSDFVVLTRRTGPSPPYQYPFDLQMERLHGQLMDWCRRNMIELEQFHVFDRDVTLFVRAGEKG